jgi:diacylglycerol kinase family enzyme
MKLTQLVAELKTIDNPDNQYLYYRQLAKFTIETEKEVHFNLDGEPVLKNRLKFSVLPKYLGVAF